MKINPTDISGVIIIETGPRVDNRGSFSRFYCEHELATIIGNRRIVQINHSCTISVGAIRGMHFQHAPHTEMKLVRCLKGRVWDVAVDLRADSPTFLKWHAEELTPGNARMMVVPEGCAHGFQVLESDSELLYLHTVIYTPDAECGVRHDDPRINIAWPLAANNISQRDASHPFIDPDFQGIEI